MQLIRPLLAERKHVLEGFCRCEGLPWVEDPTNRDFSYVRNLIRERLLPSHRFRFFSRSHSLAPLLLSTDVLRRARQPVRRKASRGGNWNGCEGALAVHSPMVYLWQRLDTPSPPPPLQFSPPTAVKDAMSLIIAINLLGFMACLLSEVPPRITCPPLLTSLEFCPREVEPRRRV